MIKPVPVKDMDTIELLELTLQLYSRSLMYKTKEMHDASVEAREELERRIRVCEETSVSPSHHDG